MQICPYSNIAAGTGGWFGNSIGVHEGGELVKVLGRSQDVQMVDTPRCGFEISG